MSQMVDGKRIVCDGEGCSEVADLPVALRSALTFGASERLQIADKWLFVREHGSWQHYCPRCSHLHLRLLAER